MAIFYFAHTSGSYIAYGLSSDTKPTSPPDNCLFIEIDTAKRFKVVASAWVEALNSAYPLTSHVHAIGDTTGLQSALDGKQVAGNYEAANANIQAHVGSAHAPSNAQVNADITKAEIEAKLTGVISSHSHAGGAGLSIFQTEIDFGSVPIKSKQFTITDANITASMKVIPSLSYDNPSDGDTDSAEWFENVKLMARAGSGNFILFADSPYQDLNGKVKVNYIFA